MASMPSSNSVLTAIESYLATRVSLGDQQAKSLHRMLLPLLTSPEKDATHASAEAFEEILDSMAEAGAFDAEAEKAIDKHFAASSEPFGIERAREKVVQRLMSAYSGLPIADRTPVVEQHRQALLSVDAAAEALISGLDHAGSLESPNIQRFAQELRYAVAVASGDATRAAVAREVIESAQNPDAEEYYEVEVEMRSKTTFGTDKETVRVWPGQSAREVARKAAEGYGAEVVEVRYQDGTLCERESTVAITQARVEALPRLQQQAGAVYTLYQIANKALQKTAGDPLYVNWDQVHQEVFDKAVGQDRQPVATVVNAIKLHSPGAVTSEQIAAVEALVESVEVVDTPQNLTILGEEDVQYVVDDVLYRAKKHGFKPDEDMVRSAVEDSADLLKVELSEEQIVQACARIMQPEKAVDKRQPVKQVNEINSGPSGP